MAKYHQGLQCEGLQCNGQWALNGLGWSNVDYIFLEATSDRTKMSLIHLIYKHIEPSIIIISNYWFAYTFVFDLILHIITRFLLCDCESFPLFQRFCLGAYIDYVKGMWMHVKRFSEKNDI
jgi:hypothetical protein